MLDSARSILLTLDNSISVRFSLKRDSYQTATRRLADFLVVRHYYVLPYLGVMERDGLITRAERGGIHMTNDGSKIPVALTHERYKNEAEALLGPVIFREIRRRTDQP